MLVASSHSCALLAITTTTSEVQSLHKCAACFVKHVEITMCRGQGGQCVCCLAILREGALDAERLLQERFCSGALTRVSLSPIGDLTIILTDVHLARDSEDSGKLPLKPRRARMRNITAHLIQRLLVQL